MTIVYFESNSHSEVAATFESEDLYIACLPALEAAAKKARMRVTESCDEPSTEIEHGKAILEANGYYVNNLWQEEDVKSQAKQEGFELEDGDAQEILDTALQNDWLMEQINVTISQEVNNLKEEREVERMRAFIAKHIEDTHNDQDKQDLKRMSAEEIRTSYAEVMEDYVDPKDLKEYEYSMSTPSLWCSFDYGTVKATSIENARKAAIVKLKEDVKKVNEVLGASDNTIGWDIQMDYDQVVVELKTEK